VRSRFWVVAPQPPQALRIYEDPFEDGREPCPRVEFPRLQRGMFVRVRPETRAAGQGAAWVAKVVSSGEGGIIHVQWLCSPRELPTHLRGEWAGHEHRDALRVLTDTVSAVSGDSVMCEPLVLCQQQWDALRYDRRQWHASANVFLCTHRRVPPSMLTPMLTLYTEAPINAG
jgi:hypothetical protein